LTNDHHWFRAITSIANTTRFISIGKYAPEKT
jgi:hypothetical protein